MKESNEYRAMPIIRSTVTKSRDGRFIIQRTTLTHIKPVGYYEAIINSKPDSNADDLAVFE